MENRETFLTQNQKLVWIGQELNPESPMYNMVMTYRIDGVISFLNFKKAFHQIVSNCDVLRSVFEVKEHGAVQKYLPTVNYEVELVDFSEYQNPEKEYGIWEEKRNKKIFNLKELAFDSVLVKLAENKYLWYINQHHLITDGWSTALLFDQLSNYYASTLNDKQEDAELLPKFQDFANETIATLKSDSKIAPLTQYWKNKVEKHTILPKLYHSNKSELVTTSKRISVSLGKHRSDKIRAFANEKGVRVWTIDLTLYNIFLTALFSYVYRVTDQESLVIGSPTHNRTSKKQQKTIGFFVEIFPLIAAIDKGETFMFLLKKVQVESNSFLKNAQTGTSSSDSNRSFNVFFNYMLNTKNSNFNNLPVHTEWVHPGHTDPRHHLRLHVYDFDNTGDIKLYFDVNTSVFSEQTQKEIPNHFLNILDAFISNANQKIETVNFANSGEILAINNWNNTKVNFTENENLLSKFNLKVKQAPNKCALVYQEDSITYKELDEKSNQVAHFLIKQGVKPNTIVAVSLERSISMMIYIYGIIKSGAAYLPIAVDTPVKRVDYILKNSEAKAIIYNHDNLGDQNFEACKAFNIKTLNQEISQHNISSIPHTIVATDLAYVIYTSGSTGNPKGVKVSHQAICNRLQWMNKDYVVTEKDVFLQKTPITFDVSVWELFWPLQIGAKLVIEIPGGHKNPEQLVQTIQQNQVTQIHFVPSMLAVFMETQGVEYCESLKRVFCSGEALSVPTVEKVYEKLGVEIHNLYGPTEAAVDVSSWYCDPKKIASGILIGKPVANTQLYILDSKLNQLPIGLPGELHIGGVQLADGYINNEDLTNKAFIPNIFSENPKAKLYKTGDLARYKEDGNIEYLGRIDTQVKLRGLRIELGEIESTIEKIDSISKAVVLVEKQKQNLVAYYTGIKIDENEIVNKLVTTLPDYMIPAAFVYLNEFEYLSSGKVDRKKLPKVFTAENKEKAKIYVAPETEFEVLVAEVWKEVLQIESISITENFISLGGNSLDAISITSRLKTELELEISITDIFNFPTIQAYAANVEQMIIQLMNEYN